MPRSPYGSTPPVAPKQSRAPLARPKPFPFSLRAACPACDLSRADGLPDDSAFGQHRIADLQPAGDTLALVRRDARYASMSRDRQALLADRRASLMFLRRWLAERGITAFDHLHGRAWSNHLIKEAELLGGTQGLGRLVLAIAHWPANPRAARYIWRRTFARRR